MSWLLRRTSISPGPMATDPSRRPEPFAKLEDFTSGADEQTPRTHSARRHIRRVRCAIRDGRWDTRQMHAWTRTLRGLIMIRRLLAVAPCPRRWRRFSDRTRVLAQPGRGHGDHLSRTGIRREGAYKGGSGALL